MASNIVVPELGESVFEATVVRWLKKEGERVNPGEAVVELETEKANFEVGAEQAGVLAKIEKKADEDVEIGDVLGVIEEGEDAAKEAEQEKMEEPEEAEEKAEEKPKDQERELRVVKEETKESDQRVTPVAKRLAAEHNVDLAEVRGTGPSDRITKQDVQNYVQEQEAQTEAAPAEEKEEKPDAEIKEKEEVPAEEERDKREERIRMSRRRRTIARRLLEAQENAAMLSTFNEIDMTAVMELRSRRKETFKEQHGVSLGLSSFFVKASIGALKAFPHVNAEIQGDEMVIKHYYDIGVAIGAEEGLVVPVIRDADRLSFAEIEKKVRELVDKTNNNNLSLDDIMGGTFTITNGGVFGSLLSTPILNPPQVGIIGLHKIEERPVVTDGEIEIRPMMYVALSYDHRIVDGREAVQFLVKFKELIEDPEFLLLEG